MSTGVSARRVVFVGGQSRAPVGVQLLTAAATGPVIALLSGVYSDVVMRGRFPMLALGALGMLTLAAALWGAALIRSPRSAYFVFVAALPLLNLFIVVPDVELALNFGPFLLTPRTVWIFVFSAIVYVLCALRRIEGPSIPRWLLGGIGLLLFGSFLSMAVSADRLASLHVLIHGVLEPLAMGLITITILNDENDVLDLILVLALSALAGIALGLLNIGLPRPTFVLESDVALVYWRGRQMGTAWYSIVIFEQVMAFLLPLTVVAAQCERTATRRRLLGACAILLAVVMLGSLKRGGLLVLLLTFLGLAVWRDYRRMLGVLLLVGIGLVAYNWHLVVDAYHTAMEAYAGDIGRLSSHRTILWANALGKIWAHGLTGLGLGQYFDEDFIQFAPNRVEFATGIDSPHQFFLQVAAEAGVTALAGVLLILGGACRQAARLLSTDHKRTVANLSRAFLLGLISFTVYAAVVEAEFLRRDINTNMYMFWIAIGALGVLAGRRRSRVADSGDERGVFGASAFSGDQ